MNGGGLAYKMIPVINIFDFNGQSILKQLRQLDKRKSIKIRSEKTFH